MPIPICKTCGKKIPANVYTRHLEKHLETPYQGETGELKKVAVVNEPSKEPEVVTANDFSGKTITLESADGKKLECSVNGQQYIGTTIEIPVELEKEVRRLLKEGGFIVYR